MVEYCFMACWSDRISLGVSNRLLPLEGLGDGVYQSLLSLARHVDGSPHSSDGAWGHHAQCR